jgi:hypothetical protein
LLGQAEPSRKRADHAKHSEVVIAFDVAKKAVLAVLILVRVGLLRFLRPWTILPRHSFSSVSTDSDISVTIAQELEQHLAYPSA